MLRYLKTVVWLAFYAILLPEICAGQDVIKAQGLFQPQYHLPPEVLILPDIDLFSSASGKIFPSWFFLNQYIQKQDHSGNSYPDETNTATLHEESDLEELLPASTNDSVIMPDNIMILYIENGGNSGDEQESSSSESEEDEDEEEKNSAEPEERQSKTTEPAPTNEPMQVQSLYSDEFLKSAQAQNLLVIIYDFARKCEEKERFEKRGIGQTITWQGMTITYSGQNHRTPVYYLLITDTESEQKFLKLYVPYKPFTTLVASFDPNSSESVYGLQIEFMEEQFLLEAKAVTQFVHPNLISGRFLVADITEGNLKIPEVKTAVVIQDYAGNSLESLLSTEQGQKLCCKHFAEILTGILEALVHLQQKQQIYVDLKNDNIAVRLLEDKVIVTLIDLASIYPYIESKNSPDRCLTTPALRAPELKTDIVQYEGFSTTIPHLYYKSVVYSLAIVIAAMTHAPEAMDQRVYKMNNKIAEKNALSQKLRAWMKERYPDRIFRSAECILGQLAVSSMDTEASLGNLETSLKILYFLCNYDAGQYTTVTLDLLSVQASSPDYNERPDFHQLMSLIRLIEKIRSQVP